jgi:tetratricopeptide (TPR) repeat protein
VVERALAAERAYQMAVVLERQHRVDEAADAAREALRLAPEQGEYICMVRWLEALRRPARAAVDDLVTSTLQAATSAAKHERAQMQAARLLQRAGRQGEALEYFRKVLALNPQNVDAAREVRLAQMREEKKAAAPAGLFGRLFRKKDG